MIELILPLVLVIQDIEAKPFPSPLSRGRIAGWDVPDTSNTLADEWLDAVEMPYSQVTAEPLVSTGRTSHWDDISISDILAFLLLGTMLGLAYIGSRPRPSAHEVQNRALETAQELVGAKLGAEQARWAAAKIVQLAPFIGRNARQADLGDMWTFFDMTISQGAGVRCEHALRVKLKANLNRHRLLLHPDKNSHPQAEQTFKFMESCHARLIRTYARQSAETMHQRTRREEQEYHQEEAQRLRREQEQRDLLKQIRREEDAKMFWENTRGKLMENIWCKAGLTYLLSGMAPCMHRTD